MIKQGFTSFAVKSSFFNREERKGERPISLHLQYRSVHIRYLPVDCGQPIVFQKCIGLGEMLAVKKLFL